MSLWRRAWSAVRGALTSPPRTEAPASPGRFGPEATTEVDPRRVGRVTMSYRPSVDGNPDPGEIVWTWVPYEEHDGRGKDRPVLIVAGGSGTALLAVQLTSKGHDGDPEQVAIGSGSWDSSGRASWVKIDRVFRVFPSGMRREAASLDKARFNRVAKALRTHHGWT